MFSGFATFEEVIQGVKINTGIQNLRNLYDDIRTMIRFAEREINPYSGFLARKKMILYNGNGIFDGNKIKKPSDFVVLDQFETCNDGLCQGQYFETINHIVLCDKEPRNSIKFTYWAIQCDSNGNPITTQNHIEAVIAYIVWKFISQKKFLGSATLNDQLTAQRFWEDRCMEARGEDFFPSENQRNEIAKTNSAEMVQLFNIRPGEDGCYEEKCMLKYEEVDPNDPNEPDDPDPNTAPTISDNSTALVKEYIFSYTDFLKDYSDAQNHPPGKFRIKGQTDFDYGVLYRYPAGIVPTPQVIVPTLELPIEKANEIRFVLNKNILIKPDGRIISYEVDDIEATIAQYLEQGYTMYEEGNNLIFKKEIFNSIPYDTDIFVFFDTTSMTVADGLAAKTALLEWFEIFNAENDDYEGNLYIIPVETENWVNYGTVPQTGQIPVYVDPPILVDADVVDLPPRWEDVQILPDGLNLRRWQPRSNAFVFAFVDEAYSDYHNNSISGGLTADIVQPTLQYINDYISFTSMYNFSYNYFGGIVYPIIKDVGLDTIASNLSEAFVNHAIAALEATLLTQQQVDDYNTPVNIDALMLTNPYMNYDIPGSKDNMKGLKNFGWTGIFDKTSPAEAVFSNQTFKDELIDYFNGLTETYIDTVILEGTPLLAETICFPFSVKEESADELESLDHNFCFEVVTVSVQKKFWSFQFDDVENDINNTDLITDQYLENTALEHTEGNLTNGTNIDFPFVGRIGFAIKTTEIGQYAIYNVEGENITAAAFDTYYDEDRKIEFYVSKEYTVPTIMYLKLVDTLIA